MDQIGDELIRVSNLHKYFPVQVGLLRRTKGYIKAVDDISFTIKKGETLGLAGESGCGKTTTGRVILRLLDATKGKVVFNNLNIFELNSQQLRNIRKDMQIIFQDPFSSLNPRMKVEQIIAEPIIFHKLENNNRDVKDKVEEIMEDVGLSPTYRRRFPHEFSGGQRQRIGIGRALAVRPKFIVCDEPVSALDVSIQAQVINLLMDLQDKYFLTYLFIAHDLGIVKHISDRIAIMYLGKIVEFTGNKELFDNPMHPYSQALLSAIPIPDPEVVRNRILLTGDVPNPENSPKGCPFHPRCFRCMDMCTTETPVFKEYSKGHYVACHLYE
jgi:oligopeptide transport system ATP-binding protein